MQFNFLGFLAKNTNNRIEMRALTSNNMITEIKPGVETVLSEKLLVSFIINYKETASNTLY